MQRRAAGLRTGSRPACAAWLFFRHSREGGNCAGMTRFISRLL